MLKRHSETVAFLAGELQEDEESGREFPDEVDGVPLSPAEKEGLMLDKIMLGGAESRRRELWRKLPQRTRIAIKRLHRQFGHPSPTVLRNILAGKAPLRSCKTVEMSEL